MDLKQLASIIKKGLKKGEERKKEMKKILDFIENHTPKSDFIKWLNTHHKQSFSDSDSWDDIKDVLLYEQKDINLVDLRLYASSLASEKDVETLLQEVKETTENAQETAQKLFYLSTFKKFSIAIGGACMAIGVFFLVGSGLLLLEPFSLGMAFKFRMFIAVTCGLIGFLNLVAGLLLVSS